MSHYMWKNGDLILVATADDSECPLDPMFIELFHFNSNLKNCPSFKPFVTESPEAPVVSMDIFLTRQNGVNKLSFSGSGASCGQMSVSADQLANLHRKQGTIGTENIELQARLNLIAIEAVLNDQVYSVELVDAISSKMLFSASGIIGGDDMELQIMAALPEPYGEFFYRGDFKRCEG